MIHIHDLNFGYENQPALFNTLSLELKPGNIYGLLGKNGTGKTTLLKILSGLLFPHHGTVDCLGFTPSERHPDFLADLYFIPEEFYTPPIKAIEFQRLYAPFYPTFDKKLFEKNLKEFEIDPNKLLSAISYGQKKKFLIAFGIAAKTKLLILDEPTNGLDIPSKTQFRKLMASDIDEDRIIIISTHQVRDVENLIDPIIILDNGKIIFNESIESINQKLLFENSPVENAQALYSEKIPGGYLIVTENQSDYESPINLEALFNAVTTNAEKIKTLFARGKS